MLLQKRKSPIFFVTVKESGLILLQTIPGSIDIENFKNTLLTTFPDIDNVHDLHIWQLTRSKYVCTAHVIFQDPKTYARIMEDVLNFFRDQGITIVTVQPEFKEKSRSESVDRRSVSVTSCLMGCRDNSCIDKSCCKSDELLVPEICHHNPKAPKRPENSPQANNHHLKVEQEQKENTSISLSNINQINSTQLRKYKSEPHLFAYHPKTIS